MNLCIYNSRLFFTMANAEKYVPCGPFFGIFMLFYLCTSCLLGVVYIYGPLLPLMFLWPWFYRRVVEILGSIWQSLIVTFCEKFLRIKMVVTGDAIERHEKTVIVMNHRTRLDWMFFFYVIFHSKILNRHKIALKSILKWFPGIGWAMQNTGYIFLDRNWESDQNHIRRILKYFVEMDVRQNVLFFPEGTDLSTSNAEKSRAYARKNNLPELQYLLHPRTKGFTHFVNTLRNVSGIQAVHDVTVAYPYNLPQSELNIVQGEVPREVHFHIKRYSISELPEDEDELSQWCQTLWYKKEKLLTEFYGQEEHSKRQFKSNKKPKLDDRSGLLYIAFVVWSLHMILTLYLFYVSSFARWYFLMIFSFYLCQGYVIGGVEKLEMLFYEQFKKPEHLWGKNTVVTREHEYGAGDASTHKSPYKKYLDKEN